jgi:hypothetical protein
MAIARGNKDNSMILSRARSYPHDSRLGRISCDGEVWRGS